MQTLEISKLFQFEDGRFLCLVLPEEPEEEDENFLPGASSMIQDNGTIYIGHESSNMQVLDITPMSIMGGGVTQYLTAGGFLHFSAPHMNMPPRWENEKLVDISHDINKYILVRRDDTVIFEKAVDHNN
ncbi:MAG: hypothetical protein OSB62_06285 [Alphaproteobacteria bacterium]|nr:hypothetical protein [Alphaproteobacteria bacterium]